MSEEDENISNAINQITEKLSNILLQEFLTLPESTQLNVVLIKSAQLLLANLLCHIATQVEELEHISSIQGDEIKALTFHCAHSGFAEKFELPKH